jgi:O-antigen/teichoic acid export membrane protein
MITIKQMLQDVSILIRGSVFAQIIGIMLIPILSRLYSPEDFGVFGLFQAAMLLISVFACLRYDQAILMATNELEAFGLFRLCITLTSVVSVIVLLVVILLKFIGIEVHQMRSLSLFWLVPATFVAGLALAATSLFTRLSAFNVASNARIFQSVSYSFFAIIAGLTTPAAWGLVLADTLGKLTFIGVGMKSLLPTVTFQAWLRDTPQLARSFIRFPKLSVAGGLLNNGGYFITRIALFSLFGAQVNGQFALADRAIALPLGLVVVTVSQVFTSHYSRLLRQDPEAARIYMRHTMCYSALIGLPPLFLCVAVAPQLFPLVFGSQWMEAGRFTQILAIMYYSSAVSGPIQTALVVSGHMGWQLAWEALSLTLFVFLWLTVAWQQWDAYKALVGFALVTIFVNFVYVWLAWFFARVEIKSGE